MLKLRSRFLQVKCSLRQGAFGLMIGLLSFALLELSYRIYLFGPGSLWYPLMKSIHTLDDELIQASSVPGLAYELRSGVDTYYKKTHFTINAAGLRDREYPRIKAPNVFRIAVIGDSFSFPDGVELEDAYHSLLEKRLNLESGAKKYEFINFSVGGYGPLAYLTVLQVKALRYSPDLILIGFCPTNDYRLENISSVKPYFPKRAPNPFFHLYSLEKLRDIFMRRVTLTGNVYERLNKEIKENALSAENLESLGEFFSKVGILAKSKGIPVVIANLNIWPTPAAYLMELQKKSKAQGFHFIDLSAPFSGNYSRKYQIFRADYHPNTAANQIFADHLYQYLKHEKLLSK